MRRIVAPFLLALACGLALGACGRGGPGGGSGAADEGADGVIRQLNSFTEEMLAKVEAAPDPKAGVTEAQQLLDARSGELAARIAALKRGGPGSADRGKWLEAEVDNTDRVHRLRVKYSDAASHDPELKARLARLIADYDAMFVAR